MGQKNQQSEIEKSDSPSPCFVTPMWHSASCSWTILMEIFKTLFLFSNTLSYEKTVWSSNSRKLWATNSFDTSKTSMPYNPPMGFCLLRQACMLMRILPLFWPAVYDCKCAQYIIYNDLWKQPLFLRHCHHNCIRMRLLSLVRPKQC